MINPKLNSITVDDVIYGYMWWDFGTYLRLDVYQNNRRIGSRKLQLTIDKEDKTITYLIRRMVGNYGLAGYVVPNYKGKFTHAGAKENR